MVSNSSYRFYFKHGFPELGGPSMVSIGSIFSLLKVTPPTSVTSTQPPTLWCLGQFLSHYCTRVHQLFTAPRGSPVGGGWGL